MMLDVYDLIDLFDVD